MRFTMFLENKDIEAKALKFATEKHNGQKRKFTGEPYIVHPKQVADIVRQYNGSTEMIQAAYLHDTLEDTDNTYEELNHEFGPVVASLVRELTSDESKLKEMGKTEYLINKMNNMSTSALIIKLIDRLSNVSDFENADPKWAKKYSIQTQNILDRLRKLTPTQQKIVNKIRDKLIIE